MTSRFLTPTQIDAVSPIGEQAAFINLLRNIDTALASAAGLHVVEFAAEHRIPESTVLQHLKLLDELGYRQSGMSKGHRHVLQYPHGQRRLFVALFVREAAHVSTTNISPVTGQRLCDECGKPFTSRFSIAVTCSAECSQLRASRQMREKYDRRKQS